MTEIHIIVYLMFLIYRGARSISPCRDLGHSFKHLHTSFHDYTKNMLSSPLLIFTFFIYLAKDANVHSYPYVFANSCWYIIRKNSWEVECTFNILMGIVVYECECP